MSPRARQSLLPEPASDDDYAAMMGELAQNEQAEPSDADVEAALRLELGLGADGIADPWEEFAPLAGKAETADPYASVIANGYGPETAAQMAAPEAPIYTPEAPPDVGDSMRAYSDDQGRLAGVDPRFRKTEADVAELGSIRSKLPQQAAPTGPGQNERAYKTDMSAQDEKARRAFMLNWMFGGPQQAMQFQQAYEQKRSAYLRGLQEARGQDQQLAQRGQRISDAQAQTLVRVYGVSPDAAANMTVGEYAQLEPVLKSAPYAVNQQEAQRNKYSQEQLDFINNQQNNQRNNAADFGTAQMKGQQALATVKANKKGFGGGSGAGGGGQERDITDVLAGTHKIDPQEAAIAVSRVHSGVPAENERQAEIMNTARMLEAASNKDFAAHRAKVLAQGVMGRTNTAYRAGVGIDAKSRDPAKRSAARIAFTNAMSQLGAAKRGFDLLSKTGAINALVKTPYGGWDSVINAMRSGEEQEAARAISAFLNPAMRKQTGAAMSVFEKELSFTQFGITDKANPFASPDALGGFLRQSRDELMNVHDAIEQEYPGALPKIRGR